MVLIIPLLGQGLDNPETWKSLGLAMGKATLMVVALFACSRNLYPGSFGQLMQVEAMKSLSLRFSVSVSVQHT